MSGHETAQILGVSTHLFDISHIYRDIQTVTDVESSTNTTFAVARP
jgi:hypothetical protein